MRGAPRTRSASRNSGDSEEDGAEPSSPAASSRPPGAAPASPTASMAAAAGVPPQLASFVNKQRKFAGAWNRAAAERRNAMRIDGLRSPAYPATATHTAIDSFPTLNWGYWLRDFLRPKFPAWVAELAEVHAAQFVSADTMESQTQVLQHLSTLLFAQMPSSVAVPTMPSPPREPVVPSSLHQLSTPGDWKPVPVPRDSESAVPLKIVD
jgi:hypothetical protein